mmetsp:Transcript_25177/g.40751  ORF Transcript_25177/g.40751 Transcript_25177/m.40751 type:complete len:786 (+) Transcript_25177:184-2541(+)
MEKLKADELKGLLKSRGMRTSGVKDDFVARLGVSVSGLKLDELKVLLKNRGLRVSGIKEDLIFRLQDHLSSGTPNDVKVINLAAQVKGANMKTATVATKQGKATQTKAPVKSISKQVAAATSKSTNTSAAANQRKTTHSKASVKITSNQVVVATKKLTKAPAATKQGKTTQTTKVPVKSTSKQGAVATSKSTKAPVKAPVKSISISKQVAAAPSKSTKAPGATKEGETTQLKTSGKGTSKPIAGTNKSAPATIKTGKTELVSKTKQSVVKSNKRKCPVPVAENKVIPKKIKTGPASVAQKKTTHSSGAGVKTMPKVNKNAGVVQQLEKVGDLNGSRIQVNGHSCFEGNFVHKLFPMSTSRNYKGSKDLWRSAVASSGGTPLAVSRSVDEHQEKFWSSIGELGETSVPAIQDVAVAIRKLFKVKTRQGEARPTKDWYLAQCVFYQVPVQLSWSLERIRVALECAVLKSRGELASAVSDNVYKQLERKAQESFERENELYENELFARSDPYYHAEQAEANPARFLSKYFGSKSDKVLFFECYNTEKLELYGERLGLSFGFIEGAVIVGSNESLVRHRLDTERKKRELRLRERLEKEKRREQREKEREEELERRQAEDEKRFLARPGKLYRRDGGKGFDCCGLFEARSKDFALEDYCRDTDSLLYTFMKSERNGEIWGRVHFGYGGGVIRFKENPKKCNVCYEGEFMVIEDGEGEACDGDVKVAFKQGGRYFDMEAETTVGKMIIRGSMLDPLKAPPHDGLFEQGTRDIGKTADEYVAYFHRRGYNRW